mmetsp:Transcript_43112/g.126763  ORF Transcript_43112/g.126763 Transcript_43112/m.126763 type:complete len:442 (-) Transcript_43112:40-1365(-)
MSKLITCLIVLTSSPRAATSVATRTCARPLLMDASIESRRPCVMSPWRAAVWSFVLSRTSCAIMSTSRFRLANTIEWHTREPSASPMDLSSSDSASSLASVVLCICTFCVMSELATRRSTSPTLIRTGSSRKSFASCRTSFGHVAENMRVWRDVSGPAGSASTTSRSCGSKPMSSIRSASSSTRKRTPLSSSVWSRMKSVSRPGVATTRSSRRPRRVICRCCMWRGWPPKRHMVDAPNAFASGFASASICCASSRVGAITTASGPTAPGFDRRATIASHSSGMRKPIVLPEPVCAIPIRSRPTSEMGRDCAWMGVRPVYFFVFMKLSTFRGSSSASSSELTLSRSSNSAIGVTSIPCVLPCSVIWCSSRKALASCSVIRGPRMSRSSSCSKPGGGFFAAALEETRLRRVTGGTSRVPRRSARPIIRCMPVGRALARVALSA